MRYRPFGKTDLHVSEIGLGTMMFGEKTGEAEAIRIIHQALDSGVNLIDVADVYAGGESERIVGKALTERRQEAFLATKVGRATPLGEGLSRANIMRAVEASLQRLKTDYLDLYQVHRWDPSVPLEETMEALTELVEQGKVRYVGCSNFEPWQLQKSVLVSDLHSLVRFESVQPRYNLMHREAEQQLLPLCQAQQVAVLAYSPLAGGILTGKYLEGVPEGSRAWQNPAWQEKRLTSEAYLAASTIQAAAERLGRPTGELAIRWCLRTPVVTTVLVGPRTESQWTEALAASQWELTSTDWEQATA